MYVKTGKGKSTLFADGLESNMHKTLRRKTNL